MSKWCCPKGRKTYHHGNLRETLIASALDILREGTLNDLSLRALARRAGVSQTAPYRHFEDKEALIAVLKAEGLLKLGAAMAKFMDTEKDPLVRLQKLGLTYIEFAQTHPAHFKVMFEYELSDYEKYCELHEVSNDSFCSLKDTLIECLALPNARKIDPMVALFSAWSMVHGIAVLFMNQSMMDHLKRDHNVDLGQGNQIAEHVTKLFAQSLVN